MPRIKRIKPTGTILPNEADNNSQASGQPGEDKLSFFDRLRQMNEQAWDNHLVYVYRRWPRISRSDQPHYIDTVRQSIDEQWLLEHHGSGRYSLRLNDKRRTIDSYVSEVHDLNHPPKVQPEELVDCPENDRYWQLWPQPKADPALAEQQPDSDAVATAVRELGKIAREKPTLDKTLADLYLQTAKSRDTLVEKLAAKPDAGVADQVSALDKILGLVERLQGKEKSGDQLTLFREMLATVREIQGTTTPKEDSSLLGRAKEMAEAVQTFRELFGKGEDEVGTRHPTGERDWWQGFLNTKAAEALAGSLGQLVTLLAMRTPGPGGNRPGMSIPATRNPGFAANPTAQSNAPTTSLPVQPNQPEGSGQPGPQTSPAHQQTSEQMMRVAIAQQVFPYVIQALTEEIPGDELAASVFTLNKLAYTQLHARGEAGLLEILQSVPEYWNQLQPLEPQVRQLIQGFVQWGDQEDQEESANGPESAAPSPETRQ